MSKNITVSEGNTARVFGNTKKLETKLQGEDAGTCFWVPEDETDAQPLYITENGLYEASEAGVYGFSEAHVNISKKVTDEDGTDWDVHIDDEGIPHITVGDPDDPYSGPDISIDDGTGNIDVHIPGNDPDSWPGWDDLDPDVKTDFDDWMDDPKFPGDWPGWDDMAPEIVDEFDDWIDDGNDPDLWPGWDDLDPDAKTDFDDWMDDPKDPDDWPGWDDIDPDAKTDFDEWTADTDTEIDPEDAGLDPDKDVDTAFDPDEQDVDMVGTNTDGIHESVEYDPETGEYNQENCPAYIQVTSMPTKTTYENGEAIDIDGIIVRAFDEEGNPWSGSDFEDGRIPANELLLDSGIAIYDHSNEAVGTLNGHLLYANGLNVETDPIVQQSVYEGGIWSGSTGGGSASVEHRSMLRWWVTMAYGGKTGEPFWLPYGDIAFKTVFKPDGSSEFVQYQINGPGGNKIRLSAEETKPITDNAHYFEDNEAGQNVTITWYSPCLKELSTTMSITVNGNSNDSNNGGATGGGGQTSGGGAGRD